MLFLKENNHLYHDITIDFQNIPQNMFDIDDENCENSNQLNDGLRYMLENQEKKFLLILKTNLIKVTHWTNLGLVQMKLFLFQTLVNQMKGKNTY